MYFLYIDPGTGSVLISLISSIFLLIWTNIKSFLYKSPYLFKKNDFNGELNFSNDIVFFNEGLKYWNVFKPILDELVKVNQPFIYLTSDLDDPGLNFSSTLCKSLYVGPMKSSLFLLNSLKAKILITTTPQLNILEWKCSENVIHYCYIFHSPVDIHAYKFFSFDYFDSILCTSDFQIRNLEYLNNLRKIKSQQLFKTGCTYYDLIENYTDFSDRDNILIAPTWGDRTFFFENGEILIQKLISLGHKVILRPHPQSWISDKEKLKSIISNFRDNPLFKLDENIDNRNSFINSKLLITDITSGIIYDSILIYKTPILAVDYDNDNVGYELSNLESNPSTKFLIQDFGKLISQKDILKIDKYLSLKIKISEDDFKNHIYNFRNSGEVASNQILSVYKSLKP